MITGVPSGEILEEDLNEYFSENSSRPEPQMILIDIKDFRKVNRVYGFIKGDKLLRTIAQEIYESMRRNEEMYKHSTLNDAKRPLWKRIYRKYPGGDEFVALVPEVDSDVAVQLAKRLTSSLEQPYLIGRR